MLSLIHIWSAEHVTGLTPPAYQRHSPRRPLLLSDGRSYLRGSFTLRCFQRLDVYKRQVPMSCVKKMASKTMHDAPCAHAQTRRVPGPENASVKSDNNAANFVHNALAEWGCSMYNVLVNLLAFAVKRRRRMLFSELAKRVACLLYTSRCV